MLADLERVFVRKKVEIVTRLEALVNGPRLTVRLGVSVLTGRRTKLRHFQDCMPTSVNMTLDSDMALDRTRRYLHLLQNMTGYNGPDAQFLPRLWVISATGQSHPIVTLGLVIAAEQCNAAGNMHGGATATIFDVCTSLAIAALQDPGEGDETGPLSPWLNLGVSRTLNVTYLAAVREGDEIEVECEVVKVGSRLAHLRGTMRRRTGHQSQRLPSKDRHHRDQSQIVALCEHGKVSVKDPANVRAESKL